MTSATHWQLPTWDACDAKPAADRTALEAFIYDQTPAGKDEAQWREELLAAILAGHEELRGREAKEEIEVTEEMIEAASDAWIRLVDEGDSFDWKFRIIYQAMAAAAPK